MTTKIIGLILLIISSYASANCNRNDTDSADLLEPYEFCDDDFINKRTPKFNNYPIVSILKFNPIFPAKIVGYDDRKEFNEQNLWIASIKQTYKNEGINFAGHYLITERDCGSSCHQFTIVDMLTGQTFRPKEISIVLASINPLNNSVCRKLEFNCNEEVLGYKKNSNLLIVKGSLGQETNKRGFYFYQWKKNGLKLISKIEKTYK